MYGQHRMYRNHGIDCCRQFFTAEEKIEHLEEYKKWLDRESKGVEERIRELKKAN